MVLIDNLSTGARLAERGEVADNPWRRMRGLLGRAALASGEGLLIRPCQGVHTWFMRFPIDVLYLDRQGVVRQVVEAMQPNRLGPLLWSAHQVLELPAGTAAATGTQVGHQLAVRVA